MATRAYIGLQHLDGRIEAIYCHHDGYTYSGGVGETLHKHYQDPEKITELLSGGDISGLGESPDASEGTTYYHRDRGEPFKDVRSIVYHHIIEFAKAADDACASYAYLFRSESGEWLVRRFTDKCPKDNFRPLTNYFD